MNKKAIKILSILLTLALTIGLFAACAKKTDTTPTQTSATTTAKPTEATKDEAPEETSKITDKDITFTYWTGLSGHVSPTATNLGETPLYQEVQNRLGIKIEFLHPPQGQEAEQFNLMIASNELPDIIESSWLSYPGGPEKAIADGVILELTDVIIQHAPNLSKYFAQYPEHEKQVKTDTGRHYVFPFIRRDDVLLTWNGPQFRQDWLEELGLEVPTTISEWEDVLLAFKDKKGADAPFSYSGWLLGSSNSFLGAYGVGRSFYQENGTVKFGPIEPGFEEFLTLFRKWYAEGLLDPDFASQDGAAFDAKVTGGRTGAMLNTVGGGMGKFLSLMKDDPSFMLVGAPFPTLNKGETPKFGHKDFNYTPGAAAAITTQCKEVEIAAKFLDYAYGEEGHILFNFGIEGESFDWIDGYPKFNEYVTNNPDGLPLAHSMARYVRSNYAGPMIQDGRYFEQYMPFPAQIPAVEIWSIHDDSRRIPPITPTPDESQQLASVMTEVNTYVDEFFIRFIMGQEALDRFDQYVDQLKKMGIEDAIKIQQAALDRYNAR